MKFVDPAVQALRQTGQISAHILYWITARNRVTDVDETLGLWTGKDSRVFQIRGSNRTFHGAGTVVGMGDLVSVAGGTIRSTEIRLAPVTAAVMQLIDVYSVRLAPVEIWRGEFDPDNNLVAAPELLFEGNVDSLSRPTPAVGEQHAGVTLRVVGRERDLTRFGTPTCSDAYQSKRAGDRILRYGSIGGVAQEVWGEKIKTGETVAVMGLKIPRGKR